MQLFVKDIEDIFDFTEHQETKNEKYFKEGSHLKIDYENILRKLGLKRYIQYTSVTEDDSGQWLINPF